MDWPAIFEALGLTPINGRMFEPLDEADLARIEQRIGGRIPGGGG